MMTKLRWMAVVGVLAIGVGACSGGSDTTIGDGGETTTTETASEALGTGYAVGFILDGSVDDGGWNSSHADAITEVRAALPGLDVQVLEEIAAGTPTTNAAQELALDGADVIIATAFAQDDIMAIAADYPDTVFLTWAGYETAPNVGHFDAATEDGRYLDGLIAGSVSESGIIGYPAAFPIEEVNRGLNAFAIGVREINPDAVVRVVFVNSWYDPPTEQQAADALVNAGADLLAHELNSPAVASVAENRGIHLIGYTSYRADVAPTAWLSSFTFEWGGYYIDQINAVIEGTWEPTITYGGLAEGMIGNAPFGPDVTDAMKELYDERRSAIIDGTLDYFAGPLVDNEGNTVIAAGETIPLDQRIACCLWLIEGVEGSVP